VDSGNSFNLLSFSMRVATTCWTQRVFSHRLFIISIPFLLSQGMTIVLFFAALFLAHRITKSFPDLMPVMRFGAVL